MALVEPRGAFFPDEFVGDARSLARFARRMIAYAPISDELPVENVLVDGDGGSSCGSSGCAASHAAVPGGDRVEHLGDGYRWSLDVRRLAHPGLLAAGLARGIGHLVRLEAESHPRAIPKPRSPP